MNSFPFCLSETLVHLLKMNSCVLFYPLKSTYYQTFIYQESWNRRESVLQPIIACYIIRETQKSRAGRITKGPLVHTSAKPGSLIIIHKPFLGDIFLTCPSQHSVRLGFHNHLCELYSLTIRKFSLLRVSNLLLHNGDNSPHICRVLCI